MNSRAASSDDGSSICVKIRCIVVALVISSDCPGEPGTLSFLLRGSGSIFGSRKSRD